MKCITRRLSWSILAALASFAVACTGADGATGPAGPSGATGENGAKGDPGDKGLDGVAAATEGTLTGTVTDAVLKDALADVTVTVKDSGGTTIGTPVKTDSAGKFTVKAPVGTVVLKLTKTNYTDSADILVGVLGGQTVTFNTTLAEAASGAPSVTLAWTGDDFGYGKTANFTATATSPTGSTLTYAWANNTATKIGSVAAGSDPKTATATLPTLADATKARSEDPANPAQYISAYKIPDAIGVLGILPDTRGAMSVAVTVSDGRGQKTTVSGSINAASVQTGLRNVAMNQRVYLNSGHDGTNAWTITSKPTGSTATLTDATTRTPSFVGDVKGKYVFSEGSNPLEVFVGDWKGAIVAGTGTKGAQGVTVSSECKACHTGIGAPDQFTAWAKTDHAIMFAKGITGDNGTSYGASCIGCHTVGYDVGVNNGGFDDVAKTSSWSYPKGDYTPTNWTSFSSAQPNLVKLAGIQCESCHGPQEGGSDGAHMSALGSTTYSSTAPKYPREYKNPRVGYSAEVCASCHASGTGHHLYSEYLTVDAKGVGHSSKAGALKGASDSAGMNSHCGRCHVAQGFVQYADQIKAGNPGNLAVAGLTSGVNGKNAEPVTCSACHDPHDKTNPNQLRFFGKTPMLASGFEVAGAGKGALCMVCHNSRNGTYVPSGATVASTYLHEDGETYNGGNPPGYSAPHQADQTDVFAGRNAYFIGLTGTISKHAAIEDTCVGCHMANNPSAHLSHGSPVANGHEFRITDANKAKLCANCHSKSVDGEGTQAQVESLLEKVAAKMAAAVKTKINAAGAAKVTVTAWDETTDLYSAPFQLDPSVTPVTSVTLEEIHGQVGFVLNFAAPMSVVFGTGTSAVTKSVSSFGVQMGSLKDTASTPVALFPLSGTLVRAGWNYFLIEGDGSLGIHNPTFAFSVLNATLAQPMN